MSVPAFADVAALFSDRHESRLEVACELTITVDHTVLSIEGPVQIFKHRYLHVVHSIGAKPSDPPLAVYNFREVLPCQECGTVRAGIILKECAGIAFDRVSAELVLAYRPYGS